MSFQSSGMEPAGTALAGNSDAEQATGMPEGMMNEPQPQNGVTGMPSGAMASGAAASGQPSVMPEGGETGEMPRGEMDARLMAAANEAEAETDTFEIPGDWRLILKRKR
jgi:hypothetical protein